MKTWKKINFNLKLLFFTSLTFILSIIFTITHMEKLLIFFWIITIILLGFLAFFYFTSHYMSTDGRDDGRNVDKDYKSKNNKE